MLILTRRYGDSILIGDDIEIVVCGIAGTQVRIGVKAPRHVKVVRSELLKTDSAVDPAVSTHDAEAHDA
jgi:carbon storage regulator